jgi:O-antigen ligase
MRANVASAAARRSDARASDDTTAKRWKAGADSAPPVSDAGTVPTGRSSLPGKLWMALLCAALLFSPWLGGMLTGVGPAAARALVAAAGIAWVVDRWRRWTLPRPAAWLWLFIGWSALTVLRGTYLHDSLTALSDLVSWVTVLTLAADAARDRRRRAAVLFSLFAGFFAVAAMGMQDGLTNIAGWRIFGPFNNPNLFAAYLIAILPVPLVAILAWHPRMSAPIYPPARWWDFLRAFGIVATGVGLVALFMTGSKGALAALGGGMLAALVLGLWRRVRVGAAVLLALVVIAALAGGHTLLNRVESATTTEAHSSQFRVLTWKGAARMAAANPAMGTGIGTFGSGFNRYAIAGWTGAAHNAYLQTAAETGLPGLVLFLIPLGVAAFWLGRVMRGSGVWTALLAAGSLACLLAAAAHNVVDYGWTLWAPTAVMWALAGLGVGRDTRAMRPMPAWAAIGSLVPLGATLAGGILMANAAAMADPATDPDSVMTPPERVAALETARSLDPLDAELARRLGFARAAVGDTTGAFSALRAATRLNPGQPTSWRYLGEGYENAGRLDEARAAFEAGLKHAPRSQSLLLDAARLAERMGRGADALALYRRIVAVAEGPVGQFPATPEIVDSEPLFAYAAVAEDEERRGKVEEARRHLESLVALANRYEQNREKYPLIWQATHQDSPQALESVQRLRADAQRRLTALKEAR